MEELKIIYLSPDDLTPYENNTRKHAPEDIESIKKSILDTGFNDPIGIWGDQNLIVEGHGRQIAAKELHLDKVPCIRLDHLTDEQRREYAIRHNRSAELSAWDFEALEEELAKLNLDGIDMDDLNFNFEEMEEMGGVQPEVTEDEAPEPPEKPMTKLGDLYQLGEHRLICGDSTDANIIDRIMDGIKADMVFTDPPYNIAGKSSNFTENSDSPHMRALAQAEWDKNFNIREALDNILIALSENATVYICTSHFLAGEIWQWMDEWAKHVQYCVWSKPNPMPSLAKRHWTWNSELICYATRGKHTFNFPKEGHALSTWTINTISGKTGHPTEKPVEVPAMAISHSSKKGDVVLDLFGGSGSTLIACEQLRRKCRMVELDPHYCDVIIERWENLTGQKAVLLNA